MNKSNQIKNYKGMQESPFNKGAGTRRVTGGSLKPNNGITLIALIITIIIMLILVGVTITVAVNGGLFNYAGRAAKETNEAIENEKLLAEGIINGQTIDDILGIAVKDDWYGITEEMETQEGVTEYHIKSCAELKKFANAVNAGNDFAGKTVYLDKNLDLQGNESKQWTPIGVDENTPFNGIFDGKNHFISGLYIDGDMTYAGLFGYIGNYEETNIIKDIGVKNSYIKAKSYGSGGIVGYNCALVTNCYNEAEIVGGDRTGGIAGFNDYKILECYNLGKITGTNAGGICGDQENELKYCYNNGSVTGTCVASGIADVCSVEDCYNTGKVQGEEECHVVGICYSADAINSYNAGEIVGNNGNIDNITFYESINSYFLSETSEDDRARTSAFMKTQEFVDLLNAGREEAIWKMDTNNINNGYPILFWQK